MIVFGIMSLVGFILMLISEQSKTESECLWRTSSYAIGYLDGTREASASPSKMLSPDFESLKARLCKDLGSDQ